MALYGPSGKICLPQLLNIADWDLSLSIVHFISTYIVSQINFTIVVNMDHKIT